MTYKVKKNFRDKTNDNKRYSKGDSYSHENEDRIAFLIKEGFLEEQGEQPSDFPKHTGGGWYELSNGKKVQGEEKATQAENELK